MLEGKQNGAVEEEKEAQTSKAVSLYEFLEAISQGISDEDIAEVAETLTSAKSRMKEEEYYAWLSEWEG